MAWGIGLGGVPGTKGPGSGLSSLDPGSGTLLEKPEGVVVEKYAFQLCPVRPIGFIASMARIRSLASPVHFSVLGVVGCRMGSETNKQICPMFWEHAGLAAFAKDS